MPAWKRGVIADDLDSSNMDHSARRHDLDCSRLSQIPEPVQRRYDLLAVPQVLLEPDLEVMNGDLHTQNIKRGDALYKFRMGLI